MSFFKVEKLYKSFGDIKAVNGIDFEVMPGEIFGVVGPDGAGKTTTFRLLVGIIDKDSGSVTIKKMQIDREPEKIREVIGYMPQQYSLYADLTVEENLIFFSNMHFVSKKDRKERFKRLYEFSRLEQYKNRKAGELSGGMYKKLALSCCLVHKPELLILDEPTTGVDPVSRRELWEIFYSLVEENIAIIISTPYMDEAERCHRVGLISDGKFLTIDNPKNIIDNFNFDVFEIMSDYQDKIERIISGIPGVVRFYSKSGIMKVVFEKQNGFEILKKVIEKEGIGYSSTEKVKPNFEDVFLALKES